MCRLTERQSAGHDLVEMKGAWCDNYCKQQNKATCKNCAIWKAIQKLAHYEDLEEQGRLIAVDKLEKELEQSTSAKYICENGTVISTDVGYVEEWLKEYVKVLKELNK